MAIATSVLATDRADPSLARGVPPPLDIAVDRCKGCELCVTACPHGVLELDVSIVNRLGYHPVRLTDAAGCTSCVICARVCPDAVFTIYAPSKEA
jgi:2-oxoglutarate ferredoxin oxidoreductase subunit delta